MTKRAGIALAVAGLLAVGGICFFFRQAPAPGAVLPQPAAQREVVFEKTELVEEEDGKRLWEFKADAVTIDETTKKIYLTAVKGTVYREDGSSVTLIARNGVADTTSKEILLEGEVLAQSSSGASFTAPKVRWAGQQQWFFADGGVRLVRQGTVISGEQLESDVNMEQMKIRGNAKVVSGGEDA